jgi:hypothetical protein
MVFLVGIPGHRPARGDEGGGVPGLIPSAACGRPSLKIGPLRSLLRPTSSANTFRSPTNLANVSRLALSLARSAI